MTLITYDELATLVNSSQLVKGMQYRIIDYETLIDEYLVYDLSTDYYVGDVNSHPMNDTNDIVTFKEYDLGHHDYDIIVFADDESTLNENARAVQRGENMLEIYYGGNLYHIRPGEVHIDETGTYVNLEVQDPDTGETTTIRIPITITISMIWYVAPDSTAYPLYQNENGEWYYITNSGDKKTVELPSGAKGKEIGEGEGESSGVATEAQVLYNEKLYTVYKSDKGELYWINVEKDVVYLNIRFDISPVNKWWYNDNDTYPVGLYPTYKDDKGYYSIAFDVKSAKFVRIDVKYFSPQSVYDIYYDGKVYVFKDEDIKTGDGKRFVMINEDKFFLTDDSSPLWYVDENYRVYPIFSDGKDFVYVASDGVSYSVKDYIGKLSELVETPHALYDGEWYEIRTKDNSYLIDTKNSGAIYLDFNFDMCHSHRWFYIKEGGDYNIGAYCVYLVDGKYIIYPFLKKELVYKNVDVTSYYKNSEYYDLENKNVHYEFEYEDVVKDGDGTHVSISLKKGSSSDVYLTPYISETWYADENLKMYPVYWDEDEESYYYISDDGSVEYVLWELNGSGLDDAFAVLYDGNTYYVSTTTGFDEGAMWYIMVDGEKQYLDFDFGISPTHYWHFDDATHTYPVYSYDVNGELGYYYIGTDGTVVDVTENYVNDKSQRGLTKGGLNAEMMEDNAILKTLTGSASARDANDDYFDGANLRAWWLKYTLFNDKSTYSWARVPTVNMGKKVPILYENGSERYYVYTGQKYIDGAKTYHIWTFGQTDYYIVYSYDDIVNNSPVLIDVLDTSFNVVYSFKSYKVWSGALHFYFDGTYNDTTTNTWNNGLGTHFKIVNYKTAMTASTSILTIEGTTVVTFEWVEDIYTDFGKGVVFRMEDEHANVMPYDFKNIMFARIGMRGAVTALPNGNSRYIVVDGGDYPYNVFDVMSYDENQGSWSSNNGYLNGETTPGMVDDSGKATIQHRFCDVSSLYKFGFGVSVGAVGNIHEYGVLYSAFKHYFVKSFHYRYTFDCSRSVLDVWTPIDTSLYRIAYCNTCDLPHNAFSVLNSNSYFCYKAKHILPNNVFYGLCLVTNNKITGNSLWNTFFVASTKKGMKSSIQNNIVNETHITYIYSPFDSEIRNSICCGIVNNEGTGNAASMNVKIDGSHSVFAIADTFNTTMMSNVVYKNCRNVYTNEVNNSVFDNVYLVFGQTIADTNIRNVEESVISAIYGSKTKGYTRKSDITDCSYIQAVSFYDTDLRDCSNIYFGKFEGLFIVRNLEMNNGEMVLFNLINGNTSYTKAIRNVRVMSGINNLIGALPPLLIPADTMDNQTYVTIVTRNSQRIVKIYNDGDQIP